MSKPSINKTAGQIIRSLMDLRNITIMDISRRTEIKKGVVSLIVSDSRPMTAQNAIKIAKVLQVITPNQLMYAQSDRLISDINNKKELLKKSLIIPKLVTRKPVQNGN